VDESFVWKHVGRDKRETLGDKLHTGTSSYVKICTQIRPCKSKSGAEARFFTVNTVREHAMNMFGNQHTAWKHSGRDKT